VTIVSDGLLNKQPEAANHRRERSERWQAWEWGPARNQIMLTERL
jgi:hypothetical protein